VSEAEGTGLVHHAPSKRDSFSSPEYLLGDCQEDSRCICGRLRSNNEKLQQKRFYLGIRKISSPQGQPSKQVVWKGYAAYILEVL